MSGNALRRIGLIGYPLGHSRSPQMQQAALDALRIPARYELWEMPPSGLPQRVASLRAPEMLGANVTIPYKTAVIPLLDSMTPEARRQAGAINTIVREETPRGVQLVGHNTDVMAVMRVLNEQAALTRAHRMLVLGAGGAAQAALGVAVERGLEPWVAARKRDAAREALAMLWARTHDLGGSAHPQRDMPEDWRRHALGLPTTEPENDDEPPALGRHMAERQQARREALRAALAETDILVNATPVGTRDPLASPIPLELLSELPHHAFVLDMVYNPPETALVRAARASGRRATGGLSMLLYQGAAAFTLWTMHEAPLQVMREALGLPDAAPDDTDDIELGLPTHAGERVGSG